MLFLRPQEVKIMKKIDEKKKRQGNKKTEQNQRRCGEESMWINLRPGA
jgi:hypothetical protein